MKEKFNKIIGELYATVGRFPVAVVLCVVSTIVIIHNLTVSPSGFLPDFLLASVPFAALLSILLKLIEEQKGGYKWEVVGLALWFVVMATGVYFELQFVEKFISFHLLVFVVVITLMWWRKKDDVALYNFLSDILKAGICATVLGGLLYGVITILVFGIEGLFGIEFASPDTIMLYTQVISFSFISPLIFMYMLPTKEEVSTLATQTETHEIHKVAKRIGMPVVWLITAFAWVYWLINHPFHSSANVKYLCYILMLFVAITEFLYYKERLKTPWNQVHRIIMYSLLLLLPILFYEHREYLKYYAHSPYDTSFWIIVSFIVTILINFNKKRWIRYALLVIAIAQYISIQHTEFLSQSKLLNPEKEIIAYKSEKHEIEKDFDHFGEILGLPHFETPEKGENIDLIFVKSDRYGGYFEGVDEERKDSTVEQKRKFVFTTSINELDSLIKICKKENRGLKLWTKEHDACLSIDNLYQSNYPNYSRMPITISGVIFY
jgi:hypothetical protein